MTTNVETLSAKFLHKNDSVGFRFYYVEVTEIVTPDYMQGTVVVSDELKGITTELDYMRGTITVSNELKGIVSVPTDVSIFITDDGHYPATDSFTDTANGELDEPWNDLSREYGAGGGIGYVISDYSGHEKVLWCNVPTDDDPYVVYRGFEAAGRYKGCVQFWISTDAPKTHDLGYMEFSYGGVPHKSVCGICWEDNIFKEWNGETEEESGNYGECGLGEWYPMSIVYNISGEDYTDPVSNTTLSSGKWRWYISGVEQFEHDTLSGTMCLGIEIKRDYGDEHSVWFDAVGVDWDSDYTVDQYLGYINFKGKLKGNIIEKNKKKGVVE